MEETAAAREAAITNYVKAVAFHERTLLARTMNGLKIVVRTRKMQLARADLFYAHKLQAGSLAGLAAHTLEAREARARNYTAVAFHATSLTRKALLKWAERAAAEAPLPLESPIAVRMLFKWYHVSTGISLHSQAELVLPDIRPSRVHLLESATSVLNRWTLASAFRAWKARTEDLAVFRVKREDSLLARALLVWRRQTVKAVRNSGLVATARRNHYLRLASSVLSSWNRVARVESSLRVRETAIVQRRNARLARSTLRAFVAAYEARKREYMARAFAQRSLLSRAVIGWHGVATDAAVERAALAVASDHYVRTQQSSVLRAWGQVASLLGRYRAAKQEAAVVYASNLMVKTWKRWRSATESSLVVKEAAAKAETAFRAARMSSILSAWLGVAHDQIHERHLDSLASSFARDRTLIPAWDTWVVRTQTRLARRADEERAAEANTRRILGRALQTWRWEQGKAMAHRWSRELILRKSLPIWRAAAAESVREGVLAEAAAEAYGQIVKKSVIRQWKEYVVYCRGVYATGEEVAARSRVWRTRDVFVRWRRATKESKAVDAEALAAFVPVQTRVYLRGWKRAMIREQRLNGAAERVQGLYHLHLVGEVFGVWAEKVRDRAAARKAEEGYVLLTMRRYFNAWHVTAGKLAHRDRVLARKAKERARSLLRAAFDAFSEGTARLRVIRERGESAVVAYERKVVDNAFQNWWEAYVGAREEAEMKVQADAFFVARQTRAVFTAWSTYAGETAATRRAEAEAEEMYRRHTLVRAMSGWKAFTTARVAVASAAGPFGASVEKRVMAKVWSAWQARMERLRVLSEVEEQVTRGRVARVLRRGIVRWAARTKEEVENAAVTDAALVHIRRVTLSQAFRGWRGVAARSKALEAAAEAVRKSALRPIFGRWRASMFLSQDMQRIRARADGVLAARVLRSWARSAGKMEKLRVLYEKGAQGTNTRLATRMIRVWAERARSQAETRVAVAEGARLLRKTYLRRAMQGWKEAVYFGRRARALEEKAEGAEREFVHRSVVPKWLALMRSRVRAREVQETANAFVSRLRKRKALREWVGWVQKVVWTREKEGEADAMAERLAKTRALARWRKVVRVTVEERARLEACEAEASMGLVVRRFFGEWRRKLDVVRVGEEVARMSEGMLVRSVVGVWKARTERERAVKAARARRDKEVMGLMFGRWVAFGDGEREAREVRMEEAGRAYERGLLVKGMKGMVRAVEEAAFVKAACAQVSRTRLRGVLRQWVDRTRYVVALEAGEARMVRMRDRRDARVALRGWKARAEREVGLKEIEGVVRARGGARVVARVWKAWAFATFARGKADVMVARREAGVKREVLAAWSGFAGKRAEEGRRLAYAVEARERRVVAGVWDRMVRLVRLSAARRERELEVVEAAFAVWRVKSARRAADAAEVEELRERLRSAPEGVEAAGVAAVLRLRAPLLASAFLRWRGVVVAIREERAGMVMAIEHEREYKARRALVGWRDWAAERRALLAAGDVYVDKVLRKVVREWAVVARQGGWERRSGEVADGWRERRVVGKMLGVWRERARVVVATREAGMVLGAARKKRMVRWVFGEWVRRAGEVKEEREGAMVADAYRETRLKEKAVVGWVGVVSRVVLLRAAESEVVRRGVERMGYRVLRFWRERVGERVAVERVVEAMGARREMRVKESVMGAWAEWAMRRGWHKRALGAYLEAKPRGAMGRVFGAWREVVERRKAIGVGNAKADYFYVSGLLSRVVGGWKEVVEEERGVRARARVLGVRHLGSRVFGVWRDKVEAAVLEREMEEGARRWERGSVVGRVFKVWRLATRARGVMRARVLEVDERRRERALRRVLGGWRGVVGRERDLRERYGFAVGVFGERAAGRMLRVWRGVVAKRVGEREKEEEVRAALRVGKLRRVFRVWDDAAVAAVEERERKEDLADVVFVAKAVRGWRRVVEKRRVLRGARDEVRVRKARRDGVWWLRRWRAAMIARKVLRMEEGSVERRKLEVLRQWAGVVRWRAEVEEKEEAFDGWREGRVVRRAFEVWVNRVKERRGEEVMKKRVMERVMKAWRGRVGGAVKERRLKVVRRVWVEWRARVVKGKVERRLVRDCVREWGGVARKRVRVREWVERVEVKRAQMLLFEAFVGWGMVVRRAKRASERSELASEPASR